MLPPSYTARPTTHSTQCQQVSKSGSAEGLSRGQRVSHSPAAFAALLLFAQVLLASAPVTALANASSSSVPVGQQTARDSSISLEMLCRLQVATKQVLAVCAPEAACLVKQRRVLLGCAVLSCSITHR